MTLVEYPRSRFPKESSIDDKFHFLGLESGEDVIQPLLRFAEA